MKAALIGYGYWGKILENYIEKSVCFELIRVFDINVVHHSLYTNCLEDVMEDDSIQAVFICTPVDTHYELCRMSLLRGKNVFCEKPTVTSKSQFDKLCLLADEKGLILYTDYIYTESRTIRKMKEHIRELGAIRLFQGEISQFGRFYQEDVAKVIGVHLFSVLVYLFPDIRIVSCHKDIDGVFGKQCCDIRMKTYEGWEIDIVCSLLSPVKTRLVKIYGEKGCLIFDMMDSDATLRLIRYTRQKDSSYIAESEDTWFYDEKNNLDYVIDDFNKAIVNSNNQKNYVVSKKVIELLESIDSCNREFVG